MHDMTKDTKQATWTGGLPLSKTRSDLTESDILEHHGVKGQKWGIRHKPVTHPRSPTETAVISAANKQGLTESRMGRLFGPDTSKKKFKLTEHEKLLLKEGAEYAGAGLLIYGGYKFAKKAGVNYLTKKNLENLGIKNATALQKAFSESVFKDAKTFINPFSLSTKEVNLSAGTVIKRLSTVKETTVKETGFFAAYKPEDIERYKAVLPIYWKSWALNPELGVELKADGSGYITHIISDRAIKAPSEKEKNTTNQTFHLST